MEPEPGHRELIDALYLEILGRRADPSGLDTFGRMLRQNGIVAAVPTMVRALLNSAEYQRRPSVPANGGSGPFQARLVNGRKIAHVVALGTHCMAGIYLRKYRYKRYSLPFDWLYSSPEAVLHCLNDDFTEFLDARHYVPCPAPTRLSRPARTTNFTVTSSVCATCSRTATPTTDKDYRYYQRTVERFRQIVAGTEAKLFRDARASASIRGGNLSGVVRPAQRHGPQTAHSSACRFSRRLKPWAAR